MNATDVECPICGALNEKLDLDETDGWMECEKCHNLDAGFMREIYEDLNEKIYYRSVIGLYQGIRGFAKENHNG